MWLRQHQHCKNLQEHSFERTVTVIPVILPGGDKLSRVCDENVTVPNPKTTTKKQSNLFPFSPLNTPMWTLKISQADAGGVVFEFRLFSPATWYRDIQIRPADTSTRSLCQAKQVTSSYCFRTALQNCSLPSTPPPKAQPQHSTAWFKNTVWTSSKYWSFRL